MLERKYTKSIVSALLIAILGLLSTSPQTAFASATVSSTASQIAFSADDNQRNADAVGRRANLADVVSVYWSFTGTLNGEPVSDYIIYREYKTISYVKGYAQKQPVCIDVWSGSRYFPELEAIAWGTFEVWRCDYEIY